MFKERIYGRQQQFTWDGVWREGADQCANEKEPESSDLRDDCSQLQLSVT